MEQQQQVETYEVPRLNLRHVNGFEGKVQNGLKVHPDRQHIIYPLGCAVVIEDISTGKPTLLWGHTNSVTCIAISKNGDMIASGQQTHLGFQTEVIVWDYRSREQMYRLKLHKVNIQALAFSPNGLYLASLGGFDDGSVVIWDMSNGQAICGSPAQVESAGTTLCINFSNDDDNIFVTGGDHTLRVWTLDKPNRKIRPEEVDMGQIKRKILCIQMHNSNPNFFFCGTATGDILAINLKTRRFQFKAPEKENYKSGVTALAHLKNNNFLVGTGRGDVCELKFPLPAEGSKVPPKPVKVRSWPDRSKPTSLPDAPISSIAMRGNGHQFFVGDRNGRIFKFSYESTEAPDQFSCDLIKTSHSGRVSDVFFQHDTSDLIFTCQHQEVRIWDLKNMQELNRYVDKQTCNAVSVTYDGKYILTAWADGFIRILGIRIRSDAEKGGKKEKYIKMIKAIEHAHQKGVTAIARTSDVGAFRIVSGGGEGQVRIWEICPDSTGLTSTLIATLKEHKAEVSDIKINGKNNECVSSSNDGTCIIWDLISCTRKQIVFANTLFKCVCYNNTETQIITSGTDRKVTYWEVFDGTMIRELEGAKSGAINALDVAEAEQDESEYNFATGGDDKLLKLWNYNGGEVIAVGVGHSATITRVKISKDKKYIVSVGEDGAILVWDFKY